MDALLNYRFMAAANGKPAELYIYNEISWWGTSAEQFNRDLQTVGDGPLVVHINSYGGEVVDATAIYNRLANRPNTITQIDGLAASAASLVAMAGQTRRIASNGYVMIHNPMVQAVGDERAMRSAAEGLTVVKSALVGTYARRSGKSTEDISAMMDAETWMTAEQAKANNFVDEITDPFLVQNSARFGPDAFKAFSRVPEAVQTAWGMPPQQPFKNNMSLFGPSDREAFLASLLTTAGLNPDEAFKAKDTTALETLFNSAIARATGEHKAQAEKLGALLVKAELDRKMQTDRVTAALNAADLELTIEKIDELKATIEKRIETAASRKMAAMSSARGINPIKTNQQESTNKPQSLRDRSIAWRKEHGLPVPA